LTCSSEQRHQQQAFLTWRKQQQLQHGSACSKAVLPALCQHSSRVMLSRTPLGTLNGTCTLKVMCVNHSCACDCVQVIEMTQVTPASDIWSVGCLIIELLTGYPPYYDLQPMSALFRIVQVSSVSLQRLARLGCGCCAAEQEPW
jgi:hypothetical protein